ncbi:hypothetical protein NC652_000404 [Populus alba x Populus x berolinensis]|nr:hypothetical protein NC652_000404 [Populus alba x Populus x berolinensis]
MEISFRLTTQRGGWCSQISWPCLSNPNPIVVTTICQNKLIGWQWGVQGSATHTRLILGSMGSSCFLTQLMPFDMIGLALRERGRSRNQDCENKDGELREGFLFTQQSDGCTKKWHLVHTLHYHRGSCRALKILNQPNKDSSGYKIWLHHWCRRYKIIQAIYNSLMETLIIPVRQIICNETRATTVYNSSRLKGSSMVNSPFKANFKYGITMFLVS